MTNEELDALVARLPILVGHTQFSAKIAAALTALRAERDAMAADIANLTASLAGEVEEVDRLRSTLADWQSGQNYRYIGRDGKPVLARDLEAERDELRVAIFGSDNYCKTLCNGNFVEMAQATEAGRKCAIAARVKGGDA